MNSCIWHYENAARKISSHEQNLLRNCSALGSLDHGSKDLKRESFYEDRDRIDDPFLKSGNGIGTGSERRFY